MFEGFTYPIDISTLLLLFLMSILVFLSISSMFSMGCIIFHQFLISVPIPTTTATTATPANAATATTATTAAAAGGAAAAATATS